MLNLEPLTEDLWPITIDDITNRNMPFRFPTTDLVHSLSLF